MSWRDLHSESERLAAEAQLLAVSRQEEQAVALYLRAAQAEQDALAALDTTKVRTRGITAVSAVALWFKGRDYVAAERLAFRALGEPTLPDFAHNELRTLVQAIWVEKSKEQAGVQFMPGQVLVSVKGGEVVTGGAPLDLIVDKVQTIQSIFYRLVEMWRGRPLRKAGKPDRETQESCRPWLFQSAPGSYQFSVAVQKPAQLDFWKEEIEPDQVAEKFMQVVSAAAEGRAAELEQAVPDEGYRQTFLRLTRNLAPTNKSFDRIEFRSSGDSYAVAVRSEARVAVTQQLKKTEAPVVRQLVEEQAAELRGVLRAIHLDKDWLEIVVSEGTRHIEGLPDAIDDVIGPMINRQVIVKAWLLKGGKLGFSDIEFAE